MATVERRDVMSAGALGIATFVLPSAAAASTGGQSQVAAPSAPVTAATVAGGVVTITLATQTSEGTHSYSVWRGASSPGTEEQADELDAAVDGGVTSFTVGGGTALDEEQPHVIVVTHTNSAGSAVSTLTLTDESTDADAASATPITYADGCGPTAVTFELTGGSGGGGGEDGAFSGGEGGGGAKIRGSLTVADGDTIRIHAGGGGVQGVDSEDGIGAGGGPGGTSALSAYAGGRGGHVGEAGSSGGGGGGGAATVLRRTRDGTPLDVVAAGGGGGGGTGNGSSDGVPIDGRPHDAGSGSTTGGQGTDVNVAKGASADGGGGGGGGGGVLGGAGGDLTEVNLGGRAEWFGQGGRAGTSSSPDPGVVTVATLDPAGVTAAGAAGASGSGTARWHSVEVAHTPS